MKSFIRISLLAATIILLAAASKISINARNSPALSAGNPAPPAAEKIYRQRCSKCHGVDGSGDTSMGRIFDSPDFTDAGWWAKHSDPGELIKTITRGKKNMPAFGRKLSKSQIASLTSYVQRFRK